MSWSNDYNEIVIGMTYLGYDLLPDLKEPDFALNNPTSAKHHKKFSVKVIGFPYNQLLPKSSIGVRTVEMKVTYLNVGKNKTLEEKRNENVELFETIINDMLSMNNFPKHSGFVNAPTFLDTSDPRVSIGTLIFNYGFQ